MNHPFHGGKDLPVRISQFYFSMGAGKGYNSAVECHLDVVEVISSSLIIPKPNGWLFWERTPGEYEGMDQVRPWNRNDIRNSALSTNKEAIRENSWKRLLIPRRLRGKRRNPPEEGSRLIKLVGEGNSYQGDDSVVVRRDVQPTLGLRTRPRLLGRPQSGIFSAMGESLTEQSAGASAAVIQRMQALSGMIGRKASVGGFLVRVKSRAQLLDRAVENTKVEYGRGRGNFRWSGEMRRDRKEHQRRKHSAGPTLTLRDES
ncbi:hypothetical protein Tco_0397772 [Tanacetum coccineum]